MVLAIPDYVMTTLRSNKYNHTRFMDAIELIMKNAEYPDLASDSIIAFLSDKLSKVDVTDIIILNYILRTSFKLNTLVDKELTAEDINKNINIILDNYTDPTTLPEDIASKQYFQLIPGDGWFLLVIEKGFGNIVRSNLRQTADYFLNIIVEKLFNMVPEEQVFLTPEFESLNKTIYVRATQKF